MSYTKISTAFVLAAAISGQCFAVTEGFEDYEVGDIHGNGAWEDFGGTLLTVVSTDQARTGAQSLKQTINPVDPNPFDIPGYGSDAFQDLPTEHTGGTWDMSYWIFVPNDFNGASILHLSESPVATSSDLDFGIQLVADGTDGFNEFLVSQDGETGNGVALIRNQWVEVGASINLDANTVTATYNGTQIFSGAWDPNPVDASDVPSIAGFNMWVQGGDTGSVYFDDISLVPEPNSGVIALMGLAFVGAMARRRK